ncbi:putative membrane protein [Kribbella steppae]|uniref:Putative membrane protein n=2 Tax=Kribbella steppae TaxID=2512223 RepID=A0A4R2HPA0_9ACTN|nr:putative membrane protein [Kribbella steppae]
MMPPVTGARSQDAPDRLSPSEADPSVAGLTVGLGGPLGRFARLSSSWWTPLRIALAVCTVTFALGVLQKAPCMDAGWDRQSWRPFKALCYSDIGFLYQERGFAEGNRPFLDTGNYPVLEYPVLTGGFMEVAARATWVITGDPKKDLTAEEKRDTAGVFFLVNVIMLFLCALLIVGLTVATARGVETRPGAARGQPLDALYVAAAPVLALTSTINWDLFAVALTSGAMFAWSRGRPIWFGILLGLGTAAKFYPFLLLGPLLIVCIRGRKLWPWFQATVATIVAWGLVNAPIYLLAKNEWMSFWTFNDQRESDYGSIWYVLKLAKHEVADVNQLNIVIFAGLCLSIAILGLMAPRPPRFAQLAFLVVAAFLLVNKVYSPQYVLWLLPLVALARPRLRDWLIWQACECFYWMLVWMHLAQFLAPGNPDQPDRIYWLSVILRMAGTLWLMLVVSRDILLPENDPVRQGDVIDDPSDGVKSDARALAPA